MGRGNVGRALLCRFGLHPGFVKVRKTLFRRCHLGGTTSEPPRRDAHHKTEFPDVAVSLVVRLACGDRRWGDGADATVRAAPKLILDPGAPQGGLRNRAVGIRDGPLATATPDESAAADPRAKNPKKAALHSATASYPQPNANAVSASSIILKPKK